MPEAVKTLQRALEKEVARESVEEVALASTSVTAAEIGAPQIVQSDSSELTQSATVHSTGSSRTKSSSVLSPSGGSSHTPRDTLDKEFVLSDFG